MNISIKDLEPQNNGHDVPKRKVFDPEVQLYINELIVQATNNAVNVSTAMMNKALSEFESKLAQIETPRAKVMAVQINQEELKRLKTPAVPYLGRMIINAKSNLNTMLVGPAGSGKTFACHQLAESLGLRFSHLNLTAGASETWLFGRHTPNGFIEADFSVFYGGGGVFLLDEIDAASSNLLMGLNTSLENGHLYNPMSGKLITRHKDFVCVSAANTVGKGANSQYTGRETLDAATLSRFIQIPVGYNKDIEESVCPNKKIRDLFNQIRVGLKKSNTDFISTRDFKQTYIQFMAGISMVEIMESISLKWNQTNKEMLKDFTHEIESLNENDSQLDTQPPPKTPKPLDQSDDRTESKPDSKTKKAPKLIIKR